MSNPLDAQVSNPLDELCFQGFEQHICFSSFLNLLAINVKNIPKNLFLCSFVVSSTVLLVTVSMLAFTAVWSNWPPPLHKRKKQTFSRVPKRLLPWFSPAYLIMRNSIWVERSGYLWSPFYWCMLKTSYLTSCNFILCCDCDVIPKLWSLYWLMWMGLLIKRMLNVVPTVGEGNLNICTN